MYLPSSLPVFSSRSHSVSYYFQTYMGVSEGRLLDVVLSPSTAKKCVAAGWIYSATIALLVAFLIPGNKQLRPTNTCLLGDSGYNAVIRKIAALSILGIILAVAIIQFMTFSKLQKRLHNSVGPVTNQGLNRLFKRAMTKSALIAIAFSIGWAPICMRIILVDWSIQNPFVSKEVIPFLMALASLQGFCNAIIFRAKHLKTYIHQKMCHC